MPDADPKKTLAYVQENAGRNLGISIDRLEEMRWAIVGVDGLSGCGCLASFDEGVAKLKAALAAINQLEPAQPGSHPRRHI